MIEKRWTIKAIYVVWGFEGDFTLPEDMLRRKQCSLDPVRMFVHTEGEMKWIGFHCAAEVYIGSLLDKHGVAFLCKERQIFMVYMLEGETTS